jgi:hypothetical protein
MQNGDRDVVIMQTVANQSETELSQYRSEGMTVPLHGNGGEKWVDASPFQT